MYSANSSPSRYSEREVIRSDSFIMLNIIPSSPGREEVAAADAIEFVERTGNPYCLYSMSLHPQGKPAMKTVDAAVESYRKWTELLKGSAVKPAILLQSIIGHWTQDLVDKEREILLRRAKSPSSVELMNNNGVWCAAPFSWKNGVVTIPSDWPCYGVKLLRIK